jgi:hypothetical protein
MADSLQNSAAAQWPKLDSSKYEEFLSSLSESCNHDEDLLRRTKELLKKTPSNTLSATEILVRVLDDAAKDAAKTASRKLGGRCTR